MLTIFFTTIISYYITDTLQRKNYNKNLRGEAKKALRHIDAIGSNVEELIKNVSIRIKKADHLKELGDKQYVVAEYLISIREHLESLFTYIRASVDDWRDMFPDLSKSVDDAMGKLSDGRTTSDELENLLGKYEQLYFKIGSKEEEIKTAQSKKEKLANETDKTKIDKLEAEEGKKELDKEIARMKKEKEKAQSERDELDREIKEKKNELKSIGNELKNIAPLTSLPFTFDSAAKTFSSSISSQASISPSLSPSSIALSHGNCPICGNSGYLINECVKCKRNVCINCFDTITRLCKKCTEIKLDPNIKIDIKKPS